MINESNGAPAHPIKLLALDMDDTLLDRDLGISAGNRRALAAAAAKGVEVVRLPVDGEGIVALDALDDALAGSAKILVSVMQANNETGALQPISEIARREIKKLLEGRPQ